MTAPGEPIVPTVPARSGDDPRGRRRGGAPRRASAAILFAAVALLGTLPAAADTLLVANKSDATVDLIDVASGTTRATLPTGVGPHEIAVSPDGRLAVVTDYGARADGNTLTVIDVAGAAVVRTIDLGRHRGPHGVEFLDGSRVAVTTEGSRSLVVVDVGTGELQAAIGTGQDVSHMVALAPSGARAYVANIGSDSMTALDIESGRKIGDVETGAEAEGIAITPDGKEVWISNRRAGTVSIVDAASLEILGELDAPGFPIRVAISPDGRLALVTGAAAGVVHVFDVRRRALTASIRLAEQAVKGAEERLFGDAFKESPAPIGVLVTPDGARAYVACSNADSVVVLSVPEGRPLGVLKTGRQPDGMAYSSVDVRTKN